MTRFVHNFKEYRRESMYPVNPYINQTKIPIDGLLVYYKFDSFVDYSGNGNTAIPRGNYPSSPSGFQDDFGVTRYCISGLDNSTIVSTNKIPLNGKKTITIAHWVYGNSGYVFGAIGDTYADNGCMLTIGSRGNVSTPGKIGYFGQNGGASFNSSGSDTVLAANKWNLLIYQIDRSKTGIAQVTMYINNIKQTVIQGDYSNYGTADFIDQYLSIGQRYGTIQGVTYNKISAFLLYNRILNEEELTRLYLNS